ncbi:pyruvate formate-lyase-activating protein [Sulfuriroseicoccus oceanibius]|uniref:Pyruvate formate-lyase-activating enzyme n=1 Tax=Sulfuriroseicoccus oceanibius TaxID=2707525 RepID=A0A6B3LBY2_9BACT|nr:pyruvate formate-lyase-activating protein [Sulfuriroseicoccus oceanibius]QQL45241.1 pyruvate formate lyase-activating protein [Sulfuriroseicoccus oceanibius]
MSTPVTCPHNPSQPHSIEPNNQQPEDVVGYVHAIETCGTVDGPGVRFITFVSGCPLRCQYCHNPDTQGPAARAAGEPMSAGEIVKDLMRYKNFLRGGGLTVSGGEPLLQPEFVRAIFTLAKENGIHTALDTSGFLGRNADDDLLSKTDLVLLDIKSWLPATYKNVTGVELEPTLAFARRLDKLGIPVWIRFVQVPGLTDAPENVEGIARFVASLGNVDRVEILPFHKMGENKYERAGKAYNLNDTPTPTPEEMDATRQIFANYGVTAL